MSNTTEIDFPNQLQEHAESMTSGSDAFPRSAERCGRSIGWALLGCLWSSGLIGSLAVVLGGMSAGDLRAGEYNQVMSIGDAAPNFENLPGTDGKQHSLADYRSARVVVLVFTCNSCPYAVDYEQRLADLIQHFSEKQSADQKTPDVAVVAVNCNLVAADSLEEMKKRAREQKFSYPYLFDESQQIGRDYGALRTPEFFVLDQERRIAYMGAFDDSPDASKVSREHLRLAVEALLAGKTIEKAETPPIGCLIRYKRQRGGR